MTNTEGDLKMSQTAIAVIARKFLTYLNDSKKKAKNIHARVIERRVSVENFVS